MSTPARPSPLDLARRPAVADSPPPPLTTTMQLPHLPLEQVEPARPAVRDEQCRTGYWNHECPHPGCVTWVPNHLHACAEHGGPR